MGASFGGGRIASADGDARGDTALGRVVRQRQDLVAEWQKHDPARSAALAQSPDKRNRQAEADNIARLAAIDARIREIDKQLAADFPDFAAFASPAPLDVDAVQAELRDNEALVLFLDTPEWPPTPEETFIWIVTKTDSRWVRSELGTRQRDDGRQTRFVSGPPRRLALRRAVLPERRAGTTLGDMQLTPDMIDTATAARGA